MPADRPQAPGYLANLMARLFHEVADEGLAPLGIRPEQFPILVELWFGEADVTAASLASAHEEHLRAIEEMLLGLAADGLITKVPIGENEKLVLTDKAIAARDDAVVAARRANQAAAGALSELEMAQFIKMTNQVIDALQAAKS